MYSKIITLEHKENPSQIVCVLAAILQHSSDTEGQNFKHFGTPVDTFDTTHWITGYLHGYFSDPGSSLTKLEHEPTNLSIRTRIVSFFMSVSSI